MCSDHGTPIDILSRLGDAFLLRAQARNAEARDLLAPAYAAFTEGFETDDLVEARSLLAELGA